MIRIRQPARSCSIAAMGALIIGLASCNILGPASYLAFGQGNADAEYELLDRSTVVFVDDRSNAIPLNSSRIRRAIADQVSADLMANEVLTDTISSRDAMATARERDREGDLLTIEAIGESVGAEQVIYVEMVSFRGSPDGFTPRPTASCRVKVIDVPNRARLFPGLDAEVPWRDVTVVSPSISTELYRSDSGRRQIEQLLAALLGDRVGKLFYAHVPDEVGSRLEPR
ncbi:MAG: hypothetical protein ACYS0G_05740 [Planctomycetota bacterium]|jgi:hypothetical protein